MSLIAHYKLDGDGKDSLLKHHGTVSGSPTVADGKLGQCYEFDGVDDHINLDKKLIVGTSQGSVSAWFYLNETSSTYQPIFNCETGPSWANLRTWLAINAGDSLFFNVSDGSNYLATSLSYPVNIGKWHHAVGTYDGQNIKLYVNGSLVGTKTSSIVPGEFTPTFTGIGWHYSNRYFNGLIEDVKVYDHALSEREVKELSKAKVLHYKFDDFVEPTQNLIFNPLFEDTSDWSLSTNGTGSFSIKYNHGIVTVPDTGSYYYIHQNLVRTTPANQPITLSAYFKNNVVGTASLRLVMFDGGTAPEQPQSYVILDGTGGYIRCEVTAVYSGTSDKLRLDILTGDYYSNIDSIDIKVTKIQLEEKDHATEFIEDIRDYGVISDCSGQGNNSYIVPSTTPKWNGSNTVGIGDYEFNGVDNLIKSDKTIMLSNTSWSVIEWIKPSDISDIRSIMSSGSYDSNTNWLSIYEQKIGIWIHQDIPERGWYTGTTVLQNGVKYMLTYTYDGNGVYKLYINGVLENTITADTQLDSLIFDKLGTHYPESRWFDGTIYEVQMYSSNLSDDDIMDIYTEKVNIDTNGNLNAHAITSSNIIKLAWKQFGGPQYDLFGTNMSDDSLHATTTSNKVIPYSESGVFASHKDMNIYNSAIKMDSVTWVKQINLYDSNGNPTNYVYPHADGIDGEFIMPCTVKLVLPSGVTMEDILTGTNGEKLNGQVKMYIDDIYYGKTDILAISSTSIGFASPSDDFGEPSDNLMFGWGARHVISYNRTSSGRDATRCQFICWTGSEDMVEEILWGVEV